MEIVLIEENNEGRMSKEMELLRIEDQLDRLYRRQEIIENQRDETFYEEELKEIKYEINYLLSKQKEIWEE